MVYLLGESFGAVLTLAAAYECKDVVDRVVLVNPATGYDQSVISTVAPLLPNVPEVMYPLVSGLMAPLIANPFNILFGDSQNAMRFVQQPSDLIEVRPKLCLKDEWLCDARMYREVYRCWVHWI